MSLSMSFRCLVSAMGCFGVDCGMKIDLAI